MSRAAAFTEAHSVSRFMSWAAGAFERWEAKQARLDAIEREQRGQNLPRLTQFTAGKRKELSRAEASRILEANEGARTIYYHHLRRFLTAYAMGATDLNVYTWSATDPACIRDKVKPQRICATLLRWRQKAEEMETGK
jgi:hypothetical protein